MSMRAPQRNLSGLEGKTTARRGAHMETDARVDSRAKLRDANPSINAASGTRMGTASEGGVIF